VSNQQKVGGSYDYLDELFRLCIGENADFTAALYQNDYSISLEEAQLRKHQYINEQLNIQAGQKVLDIGCGWGPILRYLKEIKAEGIGITLSAKQAQACRKTSLNAQIKNWKDLTINSFGGFDAIISVGAFEHFCAKEEFEQGKQDLIYQNFFKSCADLLPSGGRLFVQTQVFGKNNVNDYRQISLNAPRDSPEFLVALVEKFYPGSWLPYGGEQVIRAAEPHFKLVSSLNGRLDYLQTIKEWRKRLYAPSFKKYLKMLGLAKYYFTDPDFRFRMKMVNVAAHKKCLEREIFDHFRFVFEKK
jgi:cyclopropane-fatty-acyl-phospholipid synthase